MEDPQKLNDFIFIITAENPSCWRSLLKNERLKEKLKELRWEDGSNFIHILLFSRESNGLKKNNIVWNGIESKLVKLFYDLFEMKDNDGKTPLDLKGSEYPKLEAAYRRETLKKVVQKTIKPEISDVKKVKSKYPKI